MAIILSTGLASGLAGTDSLVGLLDGSEIRIYSGTVPTSADDSIGSATLLVTIEKDGTDPLVLVASGAAVGKPPADSWKGTPVASGSATFFRMVDSADSDAASSTAVRLQGTVGLSMGSDMALLDVNFASGVERTLNAFSVSVPLTR